MVTAKKKRKKKGAKQKKRERRWLVFFATAGLCVVLSGLFVFLVFSPEEPAVRVALYSDDAGGSEPLISYEEHAAVPEPVILETRGKKSHVASVPDDSVVAKKRPLVAILIDDMGFNEKTCEALLDLDLNLSFAFLPFGPYTEKQAYKANRLGRDVLLHFPMEASDPKWKPSPGTVTIAMDAPEIGRIFAGNLASVPYVIGINNHMGSRFTQNSPAMQDFMAIVKESGLFFLDSRTSRNTVGYSLAKKMAVSTAKRDVFLDNVRDPQKIIVQLRKLLEVAERQGFAIAIGHPYPETLQALREYNGKISRRAKVVGVAALVR